MNVITGDNKRDNGIRQRGLSNRYNYLKVQRNYAPSKAMRTCSLYTIKSLIKEDAEGLYTMIKEKGTGLKVKNYLSQESIDSIPDMKLKVNKYGSSLTGLQTCDNPYCVMCARSKAMERAETIKGVLTHTSNMDWGQYFITLTIQRQSDARIAVNDLQKRWRSVQKSLQYEYKKKQGLEVEFIKAVDVTFKPQLRKIGQCYHVHLHTIILVSKNIPLKELNKRVVNTWLNSGDAQIQVTASGQDVQDIQDTDKLSKYVSKMSGLGLELASSQTKTGKGSSLSLPQILQEIQNGKTSYVRLYEEFLTSMKNIRTMSYSKNIKILYQDYIDYIEAEYPESIEAKKSNDIVIPEKWHKTIIKIQSLFVQGAYYWFERSKFGQRQKDILESLLNTDPIYKDDWITDWLEGTLTIDDCKALSLVS